MTNMDRCLVLTPFSIRVRIRSSTFFLMVRLGYLTLSALGGWASAAIRRVTFENYRATQQREFSKASLSVRSNKWRRLNDRRRRDTFVGSEEMWKGESLSKQRLCRNKWRGEVLVRSKRRKSFGNAVGFREREFYKITPSCFETKMRASERKFTKKPFWFIAIRNSPSITMYLQMKYCFPSYI